MKLESPELSYFVGVMQGDGYLGTYKVKDRGKVRIFHKLMINAKDLEMVKEAKKIFEKTFNRKVKTPKLSSGLFTFKFLVKTLLSKLKKLEIDSKYPPVPPKWIKNNIKYFGPYLAGLIDSDGDVRIRRPKYPQCAVRITSGQPQKVLKKLVENNFNCRASLTEEKSFNKRWMIQNHGFRLEFLVSSKNFKIIKQYVLRYIQIPRKRLPIERYLERFTLNN